MTAVGEQQGRSDFERPDAGSQSESCQIAGVGKVLQLVRKFMRRCVGDLAFQRQDAVSRECTNPREILRGLAASQDNGK
jgi:hypothetical protein